MKVVVKDKKEIHLPGKTYGPGEEVELPERAALRYLEQGAVERYETKVVRERPLEDGARPSASQAAPVSRKPTLKPSKRGGRKAGAS
jgi:hypothetical protein